MAEDTVICHGAPTLAGIKSGNLFPCPYESEAELLAEIRRMNRILAPKGLELIPARYGTDGRALLYLYRRRALARDLEDARARALLEQAGYCTRSCTVCVAQLIRRLRSGEGFPHEVGLFLSYPPEDVAGFLTQGPQGAKCVGTWRVYGDVDRAQQLFRRYRACTARYRLRWSRGARLDQLVVPS